MNKVNIRTVFFFGRSLIKGSHRHVNEFEYIYNIKFTMDMQKKKKQQPKSLHFELILISVMGLSTETFNLRHFYFANT